MSVKECGFLGFVSGTVDPDEFLVTSGNQTLTAPATKTFTVLPKYTGAVASSAPLVFSNTLRPAITFPNASVVIPDSSFVATPGFNLFEGTYIYSINLLMGNTITYVNVELVNGTAIEVISSPSLATAPGSYTDSYTLNGIVKSTVDTDDYYFNIYVKTDDGNDATVQYSSSFSPFNLSFTPP